MMLHDGNHCFSMTSISLTKQHSQGTCWAAKSLHEPGNGCEGNHIYIGWVVRWKSLTRTAKVYVSTTKPDSAVATREIHSKLTRERAVQHDKGDVATSLWAWEMGTF